VYNIPSADGEVSFTQLLDLVTQSALDLWNIQRKLSSGSGFWMFYLGGVRLWWFDYSLKVLHTEGIENRVRVMATDLFSVYFSRFYQNTGVVAWEYHTCRCTMSHPPMENVYVEEDDCPHVRISTIQP